MSKRFQPVRFPARNGSDLVTRPSAEVAALSHWTVKRDWRYDLDQDVRREGDVWFNPPGGTVGQHPTPAHPDTSLPITLTFTARRPNGETAFICGTATTLYRYFHYGDGRYVASGYVASGYVEDLSGTWLEIGAGFSTDGHRWEAKNVAGTMVFNNGYDLPVSYRLEDFYVVPIYELREQGVARVETIEENGGILMCFGVDEIRADRLEEILNGENPYGPVTSPAVLNHISYRKIWSGVGQPRRWAASVEGAIEEGSHTLTLAHPMASFAAGDEILVQGAGEGGGNLITKIQWIDEMEVGLFNHAKTEVTKALVTKSDSEGLIVGSYDLQDDASPILRAIVFQDRIVVLKLNAIFVGEYTGDPDAPFFYQRVHRSSDNQNVDGPFYRWAITAPEGKYLLYPGRNRFYTFDLVTRRPMPHPKLSLCDDLFFAAVSSSDAEKVFAADNALTKEAWFCFPSSTSDKGIAYDYGSDKVSTIGESYTAGAMVAKPVSSSTPLSGTEDWFVLGRGDGSIVQYGLSTTGLQVWTRRGSSYNSDLWSGREDFGDGFNEKGMGGYLILLSTQSPNATLTVQIHGAKNPGGDLVQLGSFTFNSPQVRNVVRTHYLTHLLQDRIRATGTSNVRLSERVFQIRGVESRSVVRQ